MKITKFGHCCLLIEENGLRILTDPGVYSTKQNEVKDIDLVLITHEHKDHLHVDSLKIVLKNNPQAKVITNTAVSKILEKEGIVFTLLEDGQSLTESGVLFEGFGKLHALMHSSLTPVQNTGYFIANRLFYPGDALTNPGKQVEILALPVAGPWLKFSEAVDYTLELRPEICFAVHDGILKDTGLAERLAGPIFEKNGIKMVTLELESAKDF